MEIERIYRAIDDAEKSKLEKSMQEEEVRRLEEERMLPIIQEAESILADEQLRSFCKEHGQDFYLGPPLHLKGLKLKDRLSFGFYEKYTGKGEHLEEERRYGFCEFYVYLSTGGTGGPSLSGSGYSADKCNNISPKDLAKYDVVHQEGELTSLIEQAVNKITEETQRNSPEAQKKRQEQQKKLIELRKKAEERELERKRTRNSIIGLAAGLAYITGVGYCIYRVIDGVIEYWLR